VWRAPNTTAKLDTDNALRHPPDTGTNTDQCEFNWDGERGATRCAAKIEFIVDLSPSGIDWAARGVNFRQTQSANPAGSKFDCRFTRYRVAQAAWQLVGGLERVIICNDPLWTWDFPYSHTSVTQYPMASVPDKGYALDSAGFDTVGTVQCCLRADMREGVDWYAPDDGGWHTITPWRVWHMNVTSVLPDSTKGGANDHGSGATAQDVPNNQPVANAGSDQNVASAAVVTLNGAASSDADNDALTYKWMQTAGPTVTLSSDTAAAPTFTAPTGPAVLTFELKVSDICKALYHHRPSNYESAADSVTINVAGP
jgi:hypothetical protein